MFQDEIQNIPSFSFTTLIDFTAFNGWIFHIFISNNDAFCRVFYFWRNMIHIAREEQKRKKSKIQ